MKKRKKHSANKTIITPKRKAKEMLPRLEFLRKKFLDENASHERMMRIGISCTLPWLAKIPGAVEIANEYFWPLLTSILILEGYFIYKTGFHNALDSRLKDCLKQMAHMKLDENENNSDIGTLQILYFMLSFVLEMSLLKILLKALNLSDNIRNLISFRQISLVSISTLSFINNTFAKKLTLTQIENALKHSPFNKITLELEETYWYNFNNLFYAEIDTSLIIIGNEKLSLKQYLDILIKTFNEEGNKATYLFNDNHYIISNLPNIQDPAKIRQNFLNN